jgi:hypothetical protein
MCARTPLIMAVAHSTISDLRPYLVTRYVYMNYSMVSVGRFDCSDF